MSWRYRGWDQDETNAARRSFDADTGGWFYQFRDPNGAFSHVWAPSLDIWANAIGQGVVNAQAARVPVEIALDVARVRHAKQPRPEPK